MKLLIFQSVGSGVFTYLTELLPGVGSRCKEIFVLEEDEKLRARISDITNKENIKVLENCRCKYTIDYVNLLKKVQPDAVLVNLGGTLGLQVEILGACAILEMPTVVVVHTVYLTSAFPADDLESVRRMDTSKMTFVTVSQENGKLLSVVLGKDPSEIKTVHNGWRKRYKSWRDVKQKRKKWRSKLRKSLGLRNQDRILLTVGRIHIQKGHQMLLHEIPKIAKEIPFARFVWCGSGPLYEDIAAEVRANNLEDIVLMVGQQADMESFFLGSDFLVMPSHFEGLPYAMLEAMGYGLPVIATKVSGIPEVLENKKTGLLSPIGNGLLLRRNILKALRGEASAEKMASAAFKRLDEFSAVRMAEGVMNVIRSTIEKWNNGIL